MNRNDMVLCSIDQSMRILELGPLVNPIAPKSSGWLTTVVDRMPREHLVDKYRDDPTVDTSLIGDVDIVWSHGPLEASIPRGLHGTYDAFIASHVFEHVPDPIGLLRSLEQVLRPSGVVSLVIPDKRFCFDFFRPLSTAGGLLDAHVRKAVRHSRQALFDQVAYTIYADGDARSAAVGCATSTLRIFSARRKPTSKPTAPGKMVRTSTSTVGYSRLRASRSPCCSCRL
jgi:SAM-dependent methyltransferase